MNRNWIAASLKRVKSKAKHAWASLTDRALATLAAWRDELAAAFQHGLGPAKAHAEREFDGHTPVLAPVRISDSPTKRRSR